MRGRGFTLLEALVVISVIVLGVVVAAVLNPPRRGCGGRQMKDSTQVRALVQAMEVWAQNNNGSYPLPSMLDMKDATVEERGEGKNTTGNILSLLVFNGSIVPEMCISPAESNPQIVRHDSYQYTAPSGAMRPADALWDPSFRGTPEDRVTYGNIPFAGVGHQSYAHLMPFGKRRKQWGDTNSATEAVLGNRGPTYAQSDAAASSAKWLLLNGPLGTGSNTLLIHGGRTTWEGNIGYNDNHVNFETKGAPDALALSVPGDRPGSTRSAADNLFVNETDEIGGDGRSGTVTRGTNAYLRPIAEVSNPARPRVWRD